MHSDENDLIFRTGFETTPISMVPYWQISFKGPEEDLDRIFNEIIKIDPLVYGKTDHNAYRSHLGYEYYRPMEGTPTGGEQDTRKRPGVTEMSVQIVPDREKLEQIIQTIYEFHSYYEPPITVTPILRSRTRGLDDSKNPYRWWNNEGDWKKD